MKGQMHTDLGQVIIDEEVIATYAGINAIECFGIVGMASVNMKDGFAQLLKRDNVSKGVHIKINDNKIYIDFHIIVWCLHSYSYREFNPECKVPRGEVYRYECREN